jgi:hypothetical protein
MNNVFYRMTAETAQKLRAAKLTAAEWRIWSYLVEIEAWGDRYKDVNTLEVLSVCDVSKATYYRAIAKFQELEIFDFQDKGFSVRNLCANPSLKNEKSEKNQSQSCKEILKNETKFSKMRQNSQNCENQAAEVKPSKGSGLSQTIQTIQTDQIDRESDFCSGKKEDVSTDTSVKMEAIADPQICTEAPVKIETAESIPQAIAIEEKIDPDADLKKFIALTVETERGIQLTNPDAYVAKCLKESLDHWRSRYAKSRSPQSPQKPKESPMPTYTLEQIISGSIDREPEYAIAAFSKYPELQEELLTNHPEWSERLTGIKREPLTNSVERMQGKLAMLLAKLSLPFLNIKQRLETEEQINSLKELLVCQ